MTAKRILIIDDEEDITTLARLGLEMEAAWEVITAVSGPEGIAKAEAEQLDCILLDIMMPGMNGFAVFEKLQAKPRAQYIPVIFLTAKVQADDLSQYRTVGVAGVITKPFDFLTLANQITTILGW